MSRTRISIDAGTSWNEARRQAAFEALRRGGDVVFEFNKEDHTVTLDSARGGLPILLGETFYEFRILQRNLGSLLLRLQEDFDLVRELLSRQEKLREEVGEGS